MNLTLLNQRLDQLESDTIRRAARNRQVLDELRAIRDRIAAFIGTTPAPQLTASTDGAAVIVPLAEMEKAAILHAVAVCRHGGAAASALGIGKTTLYRKLQEYGRSDVARAAHDSEASR